MSIKKQKKKEVIHQPACHTCNGLCCRHIAKNLAKPTTKHDFDNIRWYLMHENVMAGIDIDGEWMLEVKVACRYLRKDNTCKIYHTRPLVCREYPAWNESCEHEDKTSPYSLLFTNDTQFVRWLRKKRPNWRL